jgi:hypothetical protein
MQNTLPLASRPFSSGRMSSARLLATLALAAAVFTAPVLAPAQVPTFNTVVMTATGSPPWQFPGPAAVADFDGDGKLDALTGDGSSAIRYLRGNGNGTFARSDIGDQTVTGSNTVNLHASLAPYLPNPVESYLAGRAADVNGDGRPDAIFLMRSRINWNPQGFLSVMINTGNDGAGVPQFATKHYYLPYWDVRSLTIGDLTGDGRAEIIVGSAYSNLRLYKNDGAGAFSVQQDTGILPNAGGPAVGQGAIADLNGDGKGDFVVTSAQSGSFNVFLSNGDGTVQAPTVFMVPGTTSVAAADLNKDGKADLAVGFYDGSVSTYLGTGGGAFGAPVSHATVSGAFANGLAISDLNGDGNPDVAASLYNNNTVAILAGNGTGALGSASYQSGIPKPVDVTLADFTGDGKADIAAMSANGYGGQNYAVATNTTVFAPPLPTQTLTILGGSGNVGDVAANVEYFNPATGNWQPAYLVSYASYGHPITHPWGNVPGTNHWINYKVDGGSDTGAGPSVNQTLWYQYRVRFTVPADAVNAQMTFSIKADNFAQIAINGVTAGGSPVFINGAVVPNVVSGTADQVNVDAAFSQAVQPGENTILIKVGDFGGLNGFNFRIDLSMQSSQPLEVVPVETDTTAPVITGPGNLTAEATSPAGAVVTFTATAVDDVDGPVSVLADPASGSTFALGSTVVDLGASDAAGNIATASFNVTVRDTTAPALTVPASVTAEATSAAGASVSYSSATATDAVGVTGIAYTQASGSTFALGITSVGVTASDAAGNSSTGSFNVTVRDTTAPALSVPANITAEATSAAGAAVSYAPATATDAVGVTSITYSAASGSTFALGTTSVAVQAADAAGNATSGSFTVTVQDTTAPTITNVAPSTREIWPPNKKMVPVTVSVGANDAVGIASARIVSVTTNQPDSRTQWQITGPLAVSLLADRLGNAQARVYTILIEVRDAAGNVSTQSTAVTVPHDQRR